jgi:hypothetical protein
MGQVVVLTALALATLSLPAWAEDIYRWQDGSGRVVYSNSPIDGATRIPGVAAPAPAAAPTADAAAASGDDGAAARPRPGTDEEVAAFSTSASLRRTQLERDLRDTERRLRTIDAELDRLADARTRHAGGSAATGGVGTVAVDLRSDEERTLGEERDALAQHAAELRSHAAELREEVAQALGGTPAWWTDVR